MFILPSSFFTAPPERLEIYSHIHFMSLSLAALANFQKLGRIQFYPSDGVRSTPYLFINPHRFKLLKTIINSQFRIRMTGKTNTWTDSKFSQDLL